MAEHIKEIGNHRVFEEKGYRQTYKKKERIFYIVCVENFGKKTCLWGILTKGAGTVPVNCDACKKPAAEIEGISQLSHC